jgi:twitching motility protein PilI
MAWLGVRAGALNLLFPVAEISEVMPLSACTPVPLTQPWFRGLNNVRGSLYSVIDLPALLGYAPVPSSSEARVLLLVTGRIRNTALLVNRLVGMHLDGSLTAAPQEDSEQESGPSGTLPEIAPRPLVPLTVGASAAPALMALGAHWRDAEQVDWREIDLSILVGLPDFLEVGAAPSLGALP